MSEQEREQLLDHDFDGIQEYDNPLPGWWKMLLWATVIFSAFYFFYYQIGSGASVIEKYDAAMLKAANEQLAAMGELSEAVILEMSADKTMMGGAESLFRSKCAACHGMFGEGNIGPNLTDDYWLHGSELMKIYETISEGVPEKGMLAWKKQLRPADLVAMAAYVGTLYGSDPPNPKAPQGDLSETDPLSRARANAAAAPASELPPEGDGAPATGEETEATAPEDTTAAPAVS